MSQFDEVIPRNGTNSEKWDGAEELFGRKDIIPMWVADMDFRAPKPVLDAFQRQIDHGIFGYSTKSEGLVDAVINWNKNQHQFEIDSSTLFFNGAVVPTISLSVRSLTNKGDSVLMVSPIYPPFFNITKATERKVVMSPLVYENHQYHMDFHDLETRIKEENVKLFLLCNPQNPGGRCFSKEELVQLAELCEKYQIPIISDEIHADLVMKPHKHIPMMVAAPFYADQIITLMAATKTFNLAAIKASYYIITNKDYQEKFVAEQKYAATNGLNVFGIVGTEAAYRYGAPWLNELKDYIYSNYDYVKTSLEKEVPEIGVTDLEATYLMWLDCRSLAKDEKAIYADLIEAGVGVQMGSGFGYSGKGFIRLNIACPKETLEKGVKLLIEGLKK
ncbi:pyridoxal phosphate-dependent aminotransferase [Listeria ivanovii]|uniref:MalY/PatB family protein n=1 Tax=Listeria ivanovii TaxID=1638 RepID=UPI000DA9631A|nr:MalY/PatB family protein [Listeria ivanovii]PZG31574.1 pyridoxal phosphate-dependent aminotransferase [Listeria ivanovii]PZG45329.1 pyridoxal phosphate-dependent aminotransferase [Listeria ivanovii]PZH08931.1 pyridoxal phosphate-dependent aminotransferase [Listeria ivanovii]